MWNRFRATVDIDFGALAGLDGWYFHATALAQGGGNLGLDLGLVTGPSGLVSANTTRLDSWWIEKRWLDERIAVRVDSLPARISMETGSSGRLSSSRR